MTKPPQNAAHKDSSALWRVSGLGMELTASIGGMVLLGWLIDTWAGTGHRWMLILGIVGLIGGGYNFIRGALKFQKQAAQEAERRSRERSSSPSSSVASPAGPPPDLFERSFPPMVDEKDFKWPPDDDPELRP